MRRATPDTSSIVSVLNRAFSAGIERNAEQAELLADLVVVVPTDKFSPTDYSKAAELITTGYQAAEKSSAALLRYALDETGWQAYVAARDSRRRPQPGVLVEVRVEGKAGPRREVSRDLKPFKGKPIRRPHPQRPQARSSPTAVLVNWETFGRLSLAPAPTAAPDTGLLVRLSGDRIGPPYLLISPELAAATSNITRGELTLRLVDQNLGGFGSELAPPRASAT